MITKRLKGISLFASAGIGETYFKDVGIDIVVANELLEKRADLYRTISPETTVVCGDITKEEVFEKATEMIQNQENIKDRINHLKNFLFPFYQYIPPNRLRHILLAYFE